MAFGGAVPLHEHEIISAKRPQMWWALRGQGDTQTTYPTGVIRFFTYDELDNLTGESVQGIGQTRPSLTKTIAYQWDTLPTWTDVTTYNTVGTGSVVAGEVVTDLDGSGNVRSVFTRIKDTPMKFRKQDFERRQSGALVRSGYMHGGYVASSSAADLPHAAHQDFTQVLYHADLDGEDQARATYTDYQNSLGKNLIEKDATREIKTIDGEGYQTRVVGGTYGISGVSRSKGSGAESQGASYVHTIRSREYRDDSDHGDQRCPAINTFAIRGNA